MLVVEVLVEQGDLPSGATRAFTIVTTGADSAGMARDKLSRYLDSFNWKLLEVQQSNPVADATIYEEAVSDMIARTRVNPKAIILGHFHSYKPN